MKAKSPYKVLGVKDGATDEQIRRAYIKLVKKNHPDASNVGDEEELKRINSAFEAIRALHIERGDEAKTRRQGSAHSRHPSLASVDFVLFGGLAAVGLIIFLVVSFSGQGQRTSSAAFQPDGSDKKVRSERKDVSAGLMTYPPVEVSVARQTAPNDAAPERDQLPITPAPDAAPPSMPAATAQDRKKPALVTTPRYSVLASKPRSFRNHQSIGAINPAPIRQSRVEDVLAGGF